MDNGSEELLEDFHPSLPYVRNSGVSWEGPSESVNRKRKEKRRDKEEEEHNRGVADSASPSGSHIHGEIDGNTSS